MERECKTDSDFLEFKLYQNQIIGIVSVNKEKRFGMLEILKKRFQSTVFQVRGIRDLQDQITCGDGHVIERLKEQCPQFDDIEGLLAIVDIYDNREIGELTPFEQKKVQMIAVFASGAGVLAMDDLYEDTSEEEKEELDQILTEFSVSKTILLSAANSASISRICDSIVNLDEK